MYDQDGYVLFCPNPDDLDQSAGNNYVDLSSDLTSTPGFPYHSNGFGANLENTTITTSGYTRQFNSEFRINEFSVGEPKIDILDQQKALHIFGNAPTCGRSSLTFSDARSAYIAQKSGPIRAIRSIAGNNSATRTVYTYFFYEHMIDMNADIRIHGFGGKTEYVLVADYNSNILGMNYLNSDFTNSDTPVVTDGLPDILPTTGNPIIWEQLYDNEKAISTIHEMSSRFYYEDNSTNPEFQCDFEGLPTDDKEAWGRSGTGITIASPICSDPARQDCTVQNYRDGTSIRNITYVDTDNTTESLAKQYSNNFDAPLTISLNTFEPQAILEKEKKRSVSSRIVFSCKDESVNNHSRFGRHKQSLCEYDNNLVSQPARVTTAIIQSNPFNGELCPIDQRLSNNMKVGDRNGQYSSYNQGTVTEVNLLQGHMNRLLLNEYGNQASGPIDGIFGSLTKIGVERLQNRLNQLLPTMTPLVVDGIVGPFTKAAINMSC